ncbi:MAG: hypothetical protein OSA04_03115 [Flavobacteriales bacterium]|nr:hypothetical protein [Flavobacteriales bacterium]
MIRIFLLTILLALCAFSGYSQNNRGKAERPSWLSKSWIERTYPTDNFISVRDSVYIKKMNAGEIEKTKVKLDKDLKEELANRISIKINTVTDQQTRQEDNWEDNKQTVITKTEFSEKLNITVSASFQFKFKKDFADKRYQFALRVIDRSVSATVLIDKAEGLLKNCIAEVEVSIASKSSSSLFDYENKLDVAQQYWESAIWLDPNVNHTKYSELAVKLSGFIQQVKEMDSEKKLKEDQGRVIAFMQENNYSSAVKLVLQLEIIYKNREEINDLLQNVNTQYRQYVLEINNRQRDSPLYCIDVMGDFLSYFPEDVTVLKALKKVEGDLFANLIYEAESALREENLNRAIQKVRDLDKIRIVDLQKYKQVKRDLKELKHTVVINSLDKKWLDKQYTEGWSTIQKLIADNARLLEDEQIMSYRKKFGKKCKKRDMSNARDQMPHKFSASFGSEFRYNPTEAGNIFTAQPVYDVVSGYTAYTGAIYLRRIKESSIVTKGEKKFDKSKSNLIGLKYSHLDFTTNRMITDSEDEPMHTYEDSEGWEISLDMYRNDFWHFGVGMRNNGAFSWKIDFSESNYFTTFGFQIPFKGRRSCIAFKADSWLYQSAESDLFFQLSGGIVWSPLFGRIVENRKSISNKYNSF